LPLQAWRGWSGGGCLVAGPLPDLFPLAAGFAAAPGDDGVGAGRAIDLPAACLTGARELCYPGTGAVDLGYQENADGTAIVFSTQNGIEVVSSAGT
jgi:hypothetical protein